MWGLARGAAVETGNIPLQYEMEKAIYNISNTGNKNRYYAILYRALEQGRHGHLPAHQGRPDEQHGRRRRKHRQRHAEPLQQGR